MMLNHSLKDKIALKRLNEFFAILPAIAIGGFLLVLVVCAGLTEVLPSHYLWLWLSVSLFISLFRACLVFYYKLQKVVSVQKIEFWQGLIILNGLFSGLSWGIASFIFYYSVPDSYHVYILVTLVIVLSGYFPVFVHYDKCFYAFSFPLILPAIYILIMNNTAASYYLAFLLLGYLCLMLGFARWFYNREFERNRLQFELFEQNKKVKEANDSKSLFLASASHDLRQPLQALGFYIVTLSDFLREPKKKALFDKTLKAYQALEDLLNQLLNISKLNANLVDIINTDFSILALFDQLKNDYELRALDKGLSIEFVTDDYYACSDIVSVERITRNLLENALRYTESGFIKACCNQEKEFLKITVSDSGIGIDSQHIDKIFGEFYQVKNPERDRSKGFGLGLYAVDRLTKLLGCHMQVKSELGKGSTFEITLPVGTKPAEASIEEVDERVTNTVLEEKVVMVVDDDDVVLDSIYRLLLSWECQVLTASTYQEAMSIVVEEELIPDVLVVDYRLPEYQTGVDLVEAICLSSQQKVPAVILTGDTGEESLTHINRSGLDFLHKPVDSEKLKNKMKALLVGEELIV